MSSIIDNCFLLEEKDYATFDSIIKVLKADGEVLLLYAQGTKKILSKNSRNFFYCDELEIEYFRSRTKGSFSKLKKIKSINNTRSLNFFNKNILLLNDYICSKNTNYFNYRKYKKIISNIDLFNDQEMEIIILNEIIKDSGNKIWIKSCVECNSKKIKTVSINSKGYLCNECTKRNNEYVHESEFNKSFLLLDNNSYDFLKDFKYKKELSNFLKSYLSNNVGFNIYKILEVK